MSPSERWSASPSCLICSFMAALTTAVTLIFLVVMMPHDTPQGGRVSNNKKPRPQDSGGGASQLSQAPSSPSPSGGSSGSGVGVSRMVTSPSKVDHVQRCEQHDHKGADAAETDEVDR